METIFVLLCPVQLKSNLIEIQRIETATYFSGQYFLYIFEKLNNQCKIEIIFKNFNCKTEFYEIILALLENFFFILLRNFFSSKNKIVDSILKNYLFLIVTRKFMYYNHSFKLSVQ